MPTATTATPFAEYVLPAARTSVGYGERLVKDIPADQFAHMPHPTMNHPAFNLGHLSLYPNRVFALIGRAELALEQPGFPELFKAGVACVEQDGRYPAKEEIVSYFLERHRAALATLAEVDEEVLHRSNPVEGRMREMFPTVGAAVTFLMTSHLMSHLGQISAWRRAMGLPSVM